MAHKPPTIPSMTLHKPSGLARIGIQGRDVYLGRHGTSEAGARYRQAVGEYLATNRVPRTRRAVQDAALAADFGVHRVTVLI